MSDEDHDAAVTTPADLLVKMTGLGAVTQAAFVQAEMEAMAAMMTGFTGGRVPLPPASDSEVESGFDNMPV